MRSYKFFLSISILCLSTGFSVAQIHFNSEVEQTKMIELYTSEGCSSCPPADKWLSNFKNHPDLWKRIIPLAFHVDYWDYIGWKDRFALAEYGQRQYLHSSQGNIRQVYTPGMVLNGKEWRGWYRPGDALNTAGKKTGVLSLTLDQENFSAQFLPSQKITEQTTDTILTIALLGFDLKTPVKAGENSGEMLNHDFVVLSMKSYPAAKYQWQGMIPELKLSADSNKVKALVAWVSDSNNIKPFQALGGWYR